MSGVIAVIMVAIAIWLLWRVFRSAPATAQPPETVNVREPVPRKPLNQGGAVALEESDEE